MHQWLNFLMYEDDDAYEVDTQPDPQHDLMDTITSSEA
jgi:hypothetical protein